MSNILSNNNTLMKYNELDPACTHFCCYYCITVVFVVIFEVVFAVVFVVVCVVVFVIVFVVDIATIAVSIYSLMKLSCVRRVW